MCLLVHAEHVQPVVVQGPPLGAAPHQSDPRRAQRVIIYEHVLDEALQGLFVAVRLVDLSAGLPSV